VTDHSHDDVKQPIAGELPVASHAQGADKICDSDEPPAQPNLLPGASSGRLTQRGYTIMISFGCLALPLGIESKFPSIEGYYMAFFGGVGIAGVLLGCGVYLWGYRKSKSEIERGYTPLIKKAEENPDLFLVNFRTLEVTARPHERGRPRN